MSGLFKNTCRELKTENERRTGFEVEFKEIIQQNYSNLPSNQKKIAEFFLEYINDIPFLSIQELSRKSNSSVASIVRFSKRMGFIGYAELREKIADAIQGQINNKEFFSLFNTTEIKNDTLSSVAELDIKNINDTLLAINRDRFSDAISAIIKAKKVFTAGLGISFLLSEILAYQLNQVAINAANFKRDSSVFLEQALFLEKTDLVILFSFPPYSMETVELAKYCFENKITTISITNKPSSPISFFSNYVLVVKSENMLYTNSFAAISVLINAIATEIALRTKNKVQKMIQLLDSINP